MNNLTSNDPTILKCQNCGSTDLDTSDSDDRKYGDQAAIWCQDCGECMIMEKVDPDDVFS